MEIGKVYRHAQTSGEYKCIYLSGDKAILKNIAIGWVLTAHKVRFDDFGRIYWAYSTDGHFE